MFVVRWWVVQYLTTAFDMVNRNLLTHHLADMGILWLSFSWRQRVTLGGEPSQWQCRRGWFSPWCFLISRCVSCPDYLEVQAALSSIYCFVCYWPANWVLPQKISAECYELWLNGWDRVNWSWIHRRWGSCIWVVGVQSWTQFNFIIVRNATQPGHPQGQSVDSGKPSVHLACAVKGLEASWLQVLQALWAPIRQKERSLFYPLPLFSYCWMDTRKVLLSVLKKRLASSLEYPQQCPVLSNPGLKIAQLASFGGGTM